MPKPLWINKYIDSHGYKVSVEPYEFEVLGKKFVYEANDLRVYEVDKTKTVDYLKLLGKETYTPVFCQQENNHIMIVFSVTDNCQLNCTYCFKNQQKNLYDKGITKEVVLKSLAWIADKKKISIGFFGGEPLLYFNKIKQIVSAVKAWYPDIGFSLTTNGLLLNQSIVEFLSDNGFSLVLSIDGPKELHDQHRIDKKGRGTYDKVRAGLELISKKNNLARKTTLRATYQRESQNVFFLERVMHLNELADIYDLANVSVEPADSSEGCVRIKNENLGINPRLEQEYQEAAKWFVGEIKKGEKPKLHHFTVRIKRLLNRQPQASECGAGKNYFTINQQGKIFACHRQGDCYLGNVDSGITKENTLPWKNNLLFDRKKCPECPVRYVCGGGCRWISKNNYKDINLPDRLGCWLTKTNFKLATWIIASEKERVGKLYQ